MPSVEGCGHTCSVLLQILAFRHNYLQGKNKRPNMVMEVPNNYVHFALEDFVTKLLINLP